MKITFKPSYTTGEVAQVCGFKSARVVARMFDNDEIDGILVRSRYGRQTTRQIPLKALIRFMQDRKIPLNKLSTDLDVLIRKTSDLKKTFERSGKTGVFSNINGLTERLLVMVQNLDPLTSMRGASEDRQRIKNLRRLIDVMEAHIRIRGQIARPHRK